MDKDAILEKIRHETHAIYKNAPHDLPFHGWHHIEFVRKNALRFCAELGADPFLVEAAAYVHDLNYVVDSTTHAESGEVLRKELFLKCDLDKVTVENIENIVQKASTHVRHADISPETKALSDGDTLFKVIPITPILFAKFFMDEKQVKIEDVAKRIVDFQQPLLEQDIYFYSNGAKKYMKWAKTNLELWQNVVEYLSDDSLAIGHTGIEALDRYL